MMFCQDSDLLYWDVSIFGYSNVSQLVAGSSGTLAGTTISVTGIDLTTLDVLPGQVASLTGAVTGTFPILAVTSNTLTISVLSAGLEPDDGSIGHAVNPVISGAIAFNIRTYWPQRRIVSDLLLSAAGIIPSLSTGKVPALLNPQDFKRAAVLGSMHLIYNSLAASYAGGSPANWEERAGIYGTLFSQAMRSIRAELDWTGDGNVDQVRYLGEIALRRR